MAVDWYRADGRRVTSDEAQRLLLDIGERLLAQDVIHVGTEVVVVSTWFTVVDQGFASNGRPLLWQTIVSDLTTHADIGQYTTREQAMRGHAEAVVLISKRLRYLATRSKDEEVPP
ncbi:hypothetical protein ACQP1W_46530 [Spirillospora sp. CA-255316]